MTTRRFRALGALGLAGLTGLTLAGCGAAPDSSGDSSAQASDFKGCIVSDDGGFQDRSFNQSSYEGLKAAEEHKGIKISQAESQSETEFEPNLTSMAQQGCNLTVSVGFLLADTTKKVAEANPDKHFAIVDDNSIKADNVKPIVYNTAEAAFLAGYLAMDLVLLGLGRGSGPRSVAGMRALDPPWGRPLLGVRRAVTAYSLQVGVNRQTGIRVGANTIA